MEKRIWHAATVEETLRALGTERKGLASTEAAGRLREKGENALPRARAVSPVAILLEQFRSPLVAILLVAAIISVTIGRSVDAAVIFAAVFLNVAVGFLQEYRAYAALERLRLVVVRTAVAVRDGRETLADVRTLVPGDVIRLRAGDEVPADARLITAERLSVSEAPLTGESFPVEKALGTVAEDTPLAERTNMLFLGTAITEGMALAVVVATGNDTELGTVLRLTRETPEEDTPLQRQLRAFSRWLTGVVLTLGAVVFLFGIVRGRGLGEMFLTSVAIAVAAIPEGLLIGVTVVLTVGMQRILRRRALVRKLVAAETLGATTVICTDKTGTLTEGVMHVAEIVPAAEILEGEREAAYDERVAWMVRIGMLCNDAFVENEEDDLTAWRVVGNPTERALLVAGDKIGFRKSRLDHAFHRVATLPFDADRKYMITLHRQPDDGKVLLAKGAPERILAMSADYDFRDRRERLTPEKRARMLASFERMSDRGLRLLALAYRHAPPGTANLDRFEPEAAALVFTGFVAIKDPLRSEALATIQEVQHAGVRVVLMTGDHVRTARAIAHEVGLPSAAENVLDGAALATMSDHVLAQRVADITVYARMTPKDKLRIVDAWQARGAVVAMTGDGVNDAPALRSADIGIALGSGTDLAKETASLVLLDDNFQTIVGAVKEGRVIAENIRKIVLYLLSDSFAAVTIVVGGLLIGLPLPLAAAQILWINLIADGFPHLALAVEPEEEDLMRRLPRRKDEPMVSRDLQFFILLISVTTGLTTLGVFTVFWRATGDLLLARTMAFATLGLSSLLYIFSVRAMRLPIVAVNPFRNPTLLLAVMVGLALQIAAVTQPGLQKLLGTTALSGFQWMTAAFAASGVIAVIELAKYFLLGRGKES